MNELKTSDLLVIADGNSAAVTFENYEQLKAELEKGLQYYNDCEYTPDSIVLAAKNRDELKKIKKTLDTKKKEIENAYKLPYKEVITKLDELISMVKTPLTTAEDVVKSNEDIKKQARFIHLQKRKLLFSVSMEIK